MRPSVSRVCSAIGAAAFSPGHRYPGPEVVAGRITLAQFVVAPVAVVVAPRGLEPGPRRPFAAPQSYAQGGGAVEATIEYQAAVAATEPPPADRRPCQIHHRLRPLKGDCQRFECRLIALLGGPRVPGHQRGPRHFRPIDSPGHHSNVVVGSSQRNQVAADHTAGTDDNESR